MKYPDGVVAESAIRRRLRLLRTIAMLVLLAFTAQLIRLQVMVDPSEYGQVAGSDTVEVEVAATRGAIVDRGGVALAVAVSAKNVVADPYYVSDPQGEAVKLAEILRVDAAVLAEKLSSNSRYRLLAPAVTPATWSRIEALSLPGIYSEDVTDRSYPEGNLGANLLGFVNYEGVGSGGIELAYDKLLAGTPGSESYYGAAGAGAPFSTVPPVNGSTVHLTIDRDIQWVAQQAIARRVKEAQAESGSVVVLNVKTGEILAMATAPTFNPNDYGAADPKDRGNRVLTDTYEPGSVGKIMTMAAVIEEGTMTPDSKLIVPNRYRVADKNFGDHKDHPTLHLTLTGVLAKSSNIGTIKAAQTIDEKRFNKYLRAFGIGSPTGLNFPGEESGQLLPLADWSGTSFPTFAFGQGYSVNGLQTAMVFATMANHGVRMTPKLVAGISDANGVFVPTKTAAGVRVVSASTADQVVRMMESVTGEGGTAPTARIRGYRVAGKTGTAEIEDPVTGKYNGYLASFVGLAPADNPEIVVAVSLVRPKGFSHYGGVLAGPVFREVMSFALQQLRLPPSGAMPPKLKLSW